MANMKEKDDDDDRNRQGRLRLLVQVRRLPLQPLHLPELRLLKRSGPRRTRRGPVCSVRPGSS